LVDQGSDLIQRQITPCITDQGHHPQTVEMRAAVGRVAPQRVGAGVQTPFDVGASGSGFDTGAFGEILKAERLVGHGIVHNSPWRIVTIDALDDLISGAGKAQT